MNVFSNAKGSVTGAGLKGNNIEFGPHNCGPDHAARVPGASSRGWDFGDKPEDPGAGYGLMQVHNRAAKQTLFAANHCQAGQSADLGIGHPLSNDPHWTFAANAVSYEATRLRVLARRK